MSHDAVLRRHLQGLTTLHEAVTAMSSLSAHHLRQARAAVPNTRAYRAQLEEALARAGVRFPGEGGGETLLVVVGSQLGMCGGYNGRVADAAVARRRELGPGPTLVVGRRQAGALLRRGLTPTERLPGVTSLSGLPDRVLTLAERALVAHRVDGLRAVELVAASFQGVGQDTPRATRILPLRVPETAGRPWPTRYVAPEALARDASRELLYVTLLALLTDAIASEHAARLLATRTAGDWLDDQALRLRRRLARLRQETGTQETLEIVVAARARKPVPDTGSPPYPTPS